MKISIFILLLLISAVGHSQQKQSKEDFNIWKKAVVNIETEGYIYPKHIIDSVIKSKRDSGYSDHKLDSISKLYLITIIGTGTAIYIRNGGRKYLITAKHVLTDLVLVSQKIFENNNSINKWDTLEAIYPRISIRTPYEFFMEHKGFNNFAVFNNSLAKGPKPYFFISDSTGDGIGVISLQEKNYKILDTLLQRNGYSPIPIETIITNENIKPLDEIYAIGFPEMVSVAGRVSFQQAQVLNQSTDIVTPFIVKGTVAMYEQNIQHYYVDLTITPGNSGSPIIKNGKLIGIVSGINKYRIIDDNNKADNQNLFGIGHLVNIINTTQLIKSLEMYKLEEENLIIKEN